MQQKLPKQILKKNPKYGKSLDDKTYPFWIQWKFYSGVSVDF